MEEKVPNLKLRNARAKKNWTQQEVANRIDASTLSVGRWERGEAFPNAYYRQRLCDLFDMSPEELGFTEEEQVSPPREKGGTQTHEADEETHERIAENETSPRRRKEQRSRFAVLAGILLAVAVIASAVSVYITYFAHPLIIKPGGAWISPVGKTAKGTISFAAYAYPTHQGEPAIDHVNFTAYWQGVDPRQWVIVCVTRKPVKKDIFACAANLRALGAPAGEITISFDVYDRQGNHNNSPNGPHHITYSP